MKCNLNPTKYINTTALVMWNVAGTHTRMKAMTLNFTHTGKASRVQSNGTQLHAHRQSKQSPKQWHSTSRTQAKQAESKAMALNFTHTGKASRVQSNGTQLHAHRQSKQSPEEKGWVLRADLNDATIYICCKVRCGMVCCMMWNVCSLDGLQSVKWCKMVW